MLPVSRSVQVGHSATAFATVLNPGLTPAYDCGLGIAGMPVGNFLYQATDPVTNAVVGRVNPILDVPAGGAQTYVFAVTPTAVVEPQQVKLSVKCANHRPVPEIIGVNTVLFSASLTPVPDIVALGGDGHQRRHCERPWEQRNWSVCRGHGERGGYWNNHSIGGHRRIDITSEHLSLSDRPSHGQCISAIGPSVTTQINANATPTFGIFVQGNGNVPFDPA